MEEAQVLTAAEQRKIAAAERKAAKAAEKAEKDAERAAKKAADKEAKDAAKAAAKAEKDAAKAAAKEAKAAAKGPKAPRAIKAGAISYQLTDLISVLVEGNPKRGKSAERFALYQTGMTVAAALEAGVSRTDIVWDAGRGLIYVGTEIVEVDTSAE